MKHHLPLLVPLAIALGGCSDALAPADFAGAYDLRTIDGESLLVTVPAAREGCSVSFEAGTLVLADGAFVLYLSWVSSICPGLGAVAYTFEPIGGGLTTDGDALTLRFVNPLGGSHAVIQATVTLSGDDAMLTLPPGAFGIAEAAVLTLGRHVAL